MLPLLRITKGLYSIDTFDTCQTSNVSTVPKRSTSDGKVNDNVTKHNNFRNNNRRYES